MSGVIVTRDLTNADGTALAVYGTAQVDYTVDGTTGCSYDQAVAHVGLMRATATEEVIPAYTSLVRLRQKKLDDLGALIADLSASYANFTSSDNAATATTNLSASVDAMLKTYDVSVTYEDSSSRKISKGNLQKLISEVQYQMDVVDNDLQQDMTSLQGFVTKRDNAYELAQNLMKKACQTRSKGIQYIR